jgi:hypothetical protein
MERYCEANRRCNFIKNAKYSEIDNKKPVFPDSNDITA